MSGVYTWRLPSSIPGIRDLGSFSLRSAMRDQLHDIVIDKRVYERHKMPLPNSRYAEQILVYHQYAQLTHLHLQLHTYIHIPPSICEGKEDARGAFGRLWNCGRWMISTSPILHHLSHQNEKGAQSVPLSTHVSKL